MYAVIKTGGKQYKVTEGTVLKIEKIAAEVGANVDFNDVLMVSNGDQIEIGTPRVNGGKVTATVQEQGRGKKIKIIKFKRRKHHRKQMGHRQSYTEVKITGIMAEGIVNAPPQNAEVEEPSVVEATPQGDTAQSQEVTSNGA